jgi:hypothetical protein
MDEVKITVNYDTTLNFMVDGASMDEIKRRATAAAVAYFQPKVSSEIDLKMTVSPYLARDNGETVLFEANVEASWKT